MTEDEEEGVFDALGAESDTSRPPSNFSDTSLFISNLLKNGLLFFLYAFCAPVCFVSHFLAVRVS